MKACSVCGGIHDNTVLQKITDCCSFECLEFKEKESTALLALAQSRLRDEFAMAALTGLISNPNWHARPELTAKDAYVISDAMMEAREVQR